MGSPFFQLPPDIPLLWTSPTSIQVGVDPPLATLEDIPPTATPLLHALMAGTSASGVSMLARLHGVDPLWADEMVTALQPAFHTPSPTPLPNWEVWSGSEAASRLVRVMRLTTGHVTVPETINEATVVSGDVVVLVSDYLHHPHWVNHLMRHSVPHIPVVFSDQTLSVGPLIVPGRTPCLICSETTRRDTTAHWLEVSSQLWEKASPLHREDHVGMAWALVLLTRFGVGDASAAGGTTRIVFRPATGELHHETLLAHPECSCLDQTLSSHNVKEAAAPSSGTSPRR